VFSDVLIDACLRSGAYDAAIDLLAEKRRVWADRPLALFDLEKAYLGKGDAAQAAESRDAARRLWKDMGADAERLV